MFGLLSICEEPARDPTFRIVVLVCARGSPAHGPIVRACGPPASTPATRWRTPHWQPRRRRPGAAGARAHRAGAMTGRARRVGVVAALGLGLAAGPVGAAPEPAARERLLA